MDAPEFSSLAELVQANADLVIECRGCGRTINLPRAAIIERFGGDMALDEARIRLRCKRCGRKSDATLFPKRHLTGHLRP